MLTAAAYDNHLEQLFGRLRQLHAILTAARIPYRIVGGMAVFLHVAERDPLRARLTPQLDAAIEAARRAGWDYRHAAGIDTLTGPPENRARSAVHLIFLAEKVRPEYAEPVPASAPEKTREGIAIAPVADLVRMKRTSFRLKDRVHIQDLDAVGLITTGVEAQCPLRYGSGSVKCAPASEAAYGFFGSGGFGFAGSGVGTSSPKVIFTSLLNCL